MFFSKLAASVALLGAAFANPIDTTVSKDGQLLAKRANGVHLVNCGNNYSVVVWCDNDSNCNFNPGPGNGCVSGGGLRTWEGSGSCTFSTGVTFSWSINTNAQSQPNFAVVGSGSNGFASFVIRKDDKHIMYTDGNNNVCRSIYYAL